MKSICCLMIAVLSANPALSQTAPALRLELIGGPTAALASDQPVCNSRDFPDAPARAVHLADGSVELYATDHDNRLDIGPDLRHLQHHCAIVYSGGGKDDPADFDDRAWIASPWTEDGRTVWAVIHNEFQGNLRKELCPTGKYMDCWFNSLTLAVSRDGGQSFQRAPGNALVATLPYRYDQVGVGHHGYFNPSNIVSLNGDRYMFVFATQANAQRSGNCLLRTATINDARSWRGWNGSSFVVRFVNPYTGPTQPEHHVCAPVDVGALRWPVTSLVRHAPTGIFIALMQDTSTGGGVYYATSVDLLSWSAPALLLPAIGLSAWQCGRTDPIAYPSLLDPTSSDRNFESVGAVALLFATHFDGSHCHPGMSRDLVHWVIRIQ